MAQPEDTIFLGTVSYRLSHRGYRDFLKSGLNVNQLPLLSDAVSQLQTGLERISPQEFRHPNEQFSTKDGSRLLTSDGERVTVKAGEPFTFALQDFHIQSVSFEEGSVYAKLKIVAQVATISAHTMIALAQYPAAKDGFEILRSDIIGIVDHAFGADGAGIIEGPIPADDTELKYYFIQPSRFEEEVLKQRKRQAQQ